MAFSWKQLGPVIFALYTTAERDAVTDPPAYVVLYNTTKQKLELFDNVDWQEFLTYFGTATSEEIPVWNSTEGYWEPKSPAEYLAMLSGEAAAAFDWNGQALTGILSLLIAHTATENDDHAVEIDVDAAGYGDIKAIFLDYITGAMAAGEDEGVILINIDEIAATGGDVFALEVLATEGSAGIYGLKAGVGIGPVHQDSGTFANPTTGTDNTVSTDVAAMIDGNPATTTAIFEANNEYILIGAAAAFEEMEFILTTGASGAGIKPTFWYSTAGAHQFTQFSPVDGTGAFRNTGVIAWDASDLTGHVANDDTGTFDIKIIRTRASLSTSPVLGYAKGAATTEYVWDKDGNLNLASLDVSGNIAVAGTVDGVDIAARDHAKYTGAEAVTAVATADDYLKNDASDTTTGTLTMAGAVVTGEIGVTAAPASDHLVSGITMQYVANENQAFGDVCYIFSDAGTSKMMLAKGDVIGTSWVVAMCADATISADATGTYLLYGVARDDTWNWTIGAPVFLTITGTTTNTLSATAPTAINNAVVIVGIALTADTILFNPVPQAIVEHTG